MITEEYPPSVSTATAQGDALASDVVHRGGREGWQEVIDQKLVDWGRNPDQLAEDNLIPPTRTAVTTAVRIALQMRDKDLPPPIRIVPDGDGGIVLERWCDDLSEAIEIERSGSAEYVQSHAHRVVHRAPWPAE